MKHINFLFFICLFASTTFAQQFESWIGFGGHDSARVMTSDDYQREGWEFIASGDKTINGQGLDYAYITAARFLTQAALGAEDQQVMEAATFADDFESWIDAQVQVDPNLMLPKIYEVRDIINEHRLGLGFDSSELNYIPNWQQFNYAWWYINMSNDDLLRQRVAYALSQILVISMNSDLEAHGDGVSNYYDIFIENAFGNYRDILEQVALHPCMGFYLSHLNNPRSIPSENIHPDENFAREIMQLFSIGLYELNIDGSRKVDNNGDFISTYGQDEITGLAKVFTGLGVSDVIENMYVDEAEFGIGIYLGDLTKPMKMYEEWHEPGSKTILNGEVIPAGQTGMEDIQDALDIIFAHENVGPFLALRLIQHMVKSNPSPGYIARVAAAFNDNGQGVRGDMLAVVKAILLDSEARDCNYLSDPEHGKLIEPFIRFTQFARLIDKEQFYNRIWNIGYNYWSATGQSPLLAPSVFNFFLPDYQPAGEISDLGLMGPEFQIHNSKTSIGYINQMNDKAFWTYLMDNWEEDDPAVYIDYSKLEPLAKDPEVLINYLDKHLVRGQMSAFTRNTIKDAVSQLMYGDYKFDRVRLATYLTLISPDYNVLK